MNQFSDVIEHLQTVLSDRKKGDPSHSYVVKMYAKGRKKIAQKVGEEAVEVAIAAASDDKKEVISESADLLFHLLMLWEKMDVSSDEVAQELARRKGVSGIEEKKNR